MRSEKSLDSHVFPRHFDAPGMAPSSGDRTRTGGAIALSGVFRRRYIERTAATQEIPKSLLYPIAAATPLYPKSRSPPSPNSPVPHTDALTAPALKEPPMLTPSLHSRFHSSLRENGRRS